MMKIKEFLTPADNVFTAIKAVNPAIYTSLFDDNDSSLLDIDYYYHSAEKIISPLCEGEGKENLNDIAKMLLIRFAGKWQKIHTDLTIEYQFDKPYNLTTTRNRDNNYNSKGGSNNTDTHFLKGINSDDENESEKQTGDSSTHRDDTTKETENTTVTGNLGSTPIADVLAKELEVRQNYFIDIVYKDVDSLLTLSIYE